jgi:hypothetical protein
MMAFRLGEKQGALSVLDGKKQKSWPEPGLRKDDVAGHISTDLQ